MDVDPNTWCEIVQEYIPFGKCKYVDTCSDPDIVCYGSMCDECANKCKSKFSIGACIYFVAIEQKIEPIISEKIEDVDEQLDEEMPEELSKFEDDALAKKKRKLPKIHGAKEKRFIP